MDDARTSMGQVLVCKGHDIRRPMKPLISYIRVSTSQQARSGLGIEAQREGLTRFAEAEGFEIVAEFVEVETGKGSDARDRRPQLSAALQKPAPYVALLPSASSIGFRETF